MGIYPIICEISGPYGLFCDPSSGSDPISYPVPPPSACVGIIESVVRIIDVQINIVAVASCRLPQWQVVATNSYATGQMSKSIYGGNPVQIRESWLVAPCFQILATLTNAIDRSAIRLKYQGNNNAHSMQEQFVRRLKRGNAYQVPSLGHRQLLADYVGEPRTPVETRYNAFIPSMISMSFLDNKRTGDPITNLQISNGIAVYDRRHKVGLRNGNLSLI
jgi:CRISPR-associated protein Cas5d